MLNEKAIVQVCLLAKQTSEKISQDLNEIGKDLRGIYPLSPSTISQVDEIKQMIASIEIKLNSFTLTYAYEGFRVLSGTQEPVKEEEEAPF